MQRALDARPVIATELADTLDGSLDVRLGYLPRVQDDAFVQESGFRVSALVKDHLQQLIDVRALLQGFLNTDRKLVNQDRKLGVYGVLGVIHLSDQPGSFFPLNVVTAYQGSYGKSNSPV